MGIAKEDVKSRQMQLVHWGEKVADLIAEAEDAGALVTNGYLDRLQDLKSKYESAQTKLFEFGAANADEFDGLRPGVEHAWDQLETAIRKLTKRSERGEL